MLGNDRVFWRSPPWDSLVYWALDLETGGLDPKKDAILAVGMVPVRSSAVRLGERYSTLVRPDGGDDFHAHSIQAHQLVPGELSSAPTLASVLGEVDSRLREGGLLVHQAALDVAFLKRAYARSDMRWPDPPVVDTVTLLIKAAKRARFLDPDSPGHLPNLNLLAARQNLGLPDYGQHDALTDAIATAELFLVLRRQLGARTLRELR